MTKIIAISGKKQSGKSTLAEFLRHYLNSKDRFSFNNYFYDQNTLELNLNFFENKSYVIKPETITENVSVHSFADSLKTFCTNVMSLSLNQVYGSDIEKNSLTPYRWEKIPKEISNGRTGFMTAREVMQFVGTNIMRNMFDENIWVNACINDIKSKNKPYAIIADLRFPSEYNAVLKENGIVVRLTRTPFPDDKHESETALDSCDFSHKNCIVVPDSVHINEKCYYVSEKLSKLI